MHKAKKQLDEMIPRVQQVLRQTRERVLRGNTQADGKLLSVFETHTEVIRKGKTNKPNEFGKLVVIQEAENQIVTHYQECEQSRPTPPCWKDVCSSISNSSDTLRSEWRRIPDSFPPLTNPRPSRWGSIG